MAFSLNYAILYLYLNIYCSLFYTHLIYGCLVWSYSRKSNINRLIKLQKRYIRIMNFSDFNSHTDPQYSELKLLKVNYIFSLSKLLFMSDFIKEDIQYLSLRNLCIRISPPRCFILQKGKLHDLA